MATATLSSKGQLVIPKAVREHMRLRTGDRVDFVIQDEGAVLIRPATSDVRDLRGLLHDPTRKAVSVSEMEAAVRQRSTDSAE